MNDGHKEKNWLAIIAIGLMIPVAGNALLTWRDVAILRRDLSELADHSNTVSKFWRLHGWTRDEINDLRHEHAMPASRWPDLTVESD